MSEAQKQLLTDFLGWGAAVMLLATLTRQVYSQWRDGTSRGVSKWLFIGQICASIGFVAYSWILGSWVFVVTNALILVTAVIGQFVSWYNRRQAAGH
jgi:MtN3 and saliva related transmembrane protein